MLEGIEILNQTEIITHPAWTHILMNIGALIVIISSIISLVDCIILKTEIIEFGLIGIFSGFMILIIGVGCAASIPCPTGRYVYQVTIDETVSFQELNKNYEILEQNGRIYTIKEKENE